MSVGLRAASAAPPGVDLSGHSPTAWGAGPPQAREPEHSQHRRTGETHAESRLVPAVTIDTKPMPLMWRVGRRLGFETRIRPIVRRSARSGRAGGQRDAFQMETAEYSPGGMPRSRQVVYTDWLSRELDRRGGANLEAVELVSFRRTRSACQYGGRSSEGPDAIMRGSLTISDASAFSNVLARGVGRHRAYGYGMLLLRPA